MIAFYLRLAAVAVIPLFSVTMMGALTRVHRGSGVVGLVVGMLYGLNTLGAAAGCFAAGFWMILVLLAGLVLK